MLATWFTQFKQAWLGFIYPRHCLFCRSDLVSANPLFCSDCQSRVITPASKSIKITEKHQIKVFALFLYQKPFDLIVKSKFFSDLSYYDQAIEYAQSINFFSWLISEKENTVLIPVPCHWSRYLQRGFNQADELAQLISQVQHIKIVPAIKRCKKTQFQAELDAEDRKENLKNAFSPTKYAEKITGKHIIIVDDLCTTQTTLIELSKVILKFKPASIKCFVICRT